MEAARHRRESFQEQGEYKGNQYIGFYPGTTDAFDPMQEFQNWSGADYKNADRSMDRRPHNFYQMVARAYVASCARKFPKAAPPR